ncbi:Rieske 2Fe-2S domain-containing protein [Mycobacterium sp.]|uniref:Rieske 2Fe-2S domain-containing protein n=1 Tax=Mycobacterium sp. TaxID=1785 RepID=UPI003C771180
MTATGASLASPSELDASGQISAEWILWGSSDEVVARRAVPVTIGGRHLVLWRQSNGSLRCLDGICRHLGASLGHAGTVEGDRLRCPFHGWTYNGDGVNVEQPGIASDTGQRVNTRLEAFEVLEDSGLVYIASGRHEATGSGHLDAATLRRLLRDAMGGEETASGSLVIGHPLRWIVRTSHPRSRAPEDTTPMHWSWPHSGQTFESILARYAGPVGAAGRQSGWSPVRPSSRAEFCEGPVSAINGLHVASPLVRFLGMATDPTLDWRTIGQGVHIARLRRVPPTLALRSESRRDRALTRIFRGSRLICSITPLTPSELLVTCVGVYPSWQRLDRVGCDLRDRLVRTAFGRRLEHLASSVAASEDVELSQVAGSAALLEVR